jgi:hypothetical protein
MDTKQDWKGLDGDIAWHFIERQAENWNQVGEMMNEWLKANTPTKEWVGLTVDQMTAIAEWQLSAHRPLIDVIKAVEQALREKNT